MSHPATLFRREALEARARGQHRAGGVVHLTSPWRSWLYRLTVLLVLGGLVSLWLIRTDERASGPAVVDGRTGAVTVLLPAASAPYLTASSELRVDLPGSRRGAVPVVVQQARQASDADIRAAGLRPIAQPGLLLTGQLHDRNTRSPGPLSPVSTTASVVIRSERLVDLLARRVGSMLGDGEAQP